MDEREPIRAMDDGSRDLYDIATWERRTPLDRVAVAIYRFLGLTFQATVVIVAFLILLGIGGLSALTDPQVGTLTVLSAIPAFGLAFYVYYSDTTSGEPLAVLVATFLLGILTANFAAVVNTLLGPLFDPFGFLGTVVMFFLVVGPVEETVKLLAVRLYAYDRPTFDCVIDGAVYGAMAGLGFATVENSLFITRQVGDLGMGVGLVELIGAGGGITAVRALAGPGHVIYSAVAGYYLGLAKFNPENRGPIVLKGLLIAAFIHATYNSTVGIGSTLIAGLLGVPPLVGFIGYVILYDGVWGLYLFRKVRRYSETFHRLDRSEDGDPDGATRPDRAESVTETETE
ncbi:MAG: PrsW family intramembrane metalloprotease [Haloarculaceae archaeon]